MKTEAIEIVDRGRGPQLSTSRITVQDVVPYFLAECSDDEILRWLPTLSREEIAVVRRYYLEHQEELDARDRRVREFREEQIRLQRQRVPVPDESDAQRMARLKQLLHQRLQEKNGEGNPG